MITTEMTFTTPNTTPNGIFIIVKQNKKLLAVWVPTEIRNNVASEIVLFYCSQLLPKATSHFLNAQGIVYDLLKICGVFVGKMVTNADLKLTFFFGLFLEEEPVVASADRTRGPDANALKCSSSKLGT